MADLDIFLMEDLISSSPVQRQISHKRSSHVLEM
jgi:hypothetical protein